jgi:uncharacterized protein YhfF
MTKKTGKTKTHVKTNEKIINKQKAAEHAWMQGDGVGNTLIQIVLQKKKKAAEHAWMQGDGVGTTTLGKNAEKSCSRV